jgi:hypothetical protein
MRSVTLHAHFLFVNAKVYVWFQVLKAACMKTAVIQLLRLVVCWKLTDVSEVLTASIIRANHNIPDDSRLRQVLLRSLINSVKQVGRASKELQYATLSKLVPRSSNYEMKQRDHPLCLMISKTCNFCSKYRMGHKSLDKNAFKPQIFLFSLLFPVLNMTRSLDAFRVDCVDDCTKLCATMLRFSSVVTDLGLPDRERSATDPVCSNLLFKLWITCRDGVTLFGKLSTISQQRLCNCSHVATISEVQKHALPLITSYPL